MNLQLYVCQLGVDYMKNFNHDRKFQPGSRAETSVDFIKNSARAEN